MIQHKHNKNSEIKDIDDFFSSVIKDSKTNASNIPWKCGFYKIWFSVRRFFVGEKIVKKPDLNLIDQVESILDVYEDEPSVESIGKCQKFIELHRIMENTNARRRLEKWATKIISMYLLFVFVILLINGFIKTYYNLDFIKDNIMLAILTTTTINIIGLVIIVLKGYFYENDMKNFHTKDTNE